MKEKDITQKVLEDNNDIFADIVNVLLFDGKSEVEENELVNTTVHSQYKAEDGKVHEQERDIAKYWKRGCTDIVLYGIENQTKVEKRMPARISGYEGASYRGQYDKKTIVPVITMVLYYGTDRKWTAPKNLKSLIKVPDNLDKYVNDTKANVFEIAWLTDEQIAKFTSDYKIVANFFVNKRKNKDYIPDDKTTIKHVDEILKFLSVMTGDNRYQEILSDKEGVSNMCDVAQRLEDRGIEKGMKAGIEKGIKEGIKQGLQKGREEGNQMIYSLVEDESISMERGAQKLGISVEKLRANMINAGYKCPDKSSPFLCVNSSFSYIKYVYAAFIFSNVL